MGVAAVAVGATAVAVVVRKSEPAVCVERRLLCHRKKASVEAAVGWDAGVTYTSTTDLHRNLAQDSKICAKVRQLMRMVHIANMYVNKTEISNCLQFM